MKGHVMDAGVCQAVAVSRRGSLRLLGGAALVSALAAPEAARAGKAGKLARKRCKRQQADCEATVRANCFENETCLNALLPCCALLATCNAGGATQCFLSG